MSERVGYLRWIDVRGEHHHVLRCWSLFEGEEYGLDIDIDRWRVGGPIDGEDLCERLERHVTAALVKAGATRVEDEPGEAWSRHAAIVAVERP